MTAPIERTPTAASSSLGPLVGSANGQHGAAALAAVPRRGPRPRGSSPRSRRGRKCGGWARAPVWAFRASGGHDSRTEAGRIVPVCRLNCSLACAPGPPAASVVCAIEVPGDTTCPATIRWQLRARIARRRAGSATSSAPIAFRSRRLSLLVPPPDREQPTVAIGPVVRDGAGERLRELPREPVRSAGRRHAGHSPIRAGGRWRCGCSRPS